MLACSSIATFGYLAFWIYFANKVAGQIFSYGLILSSIVISIVMLRRDANSPLVVGELLAPILYVFVTGLCYLSLFYTFSDPFRSGADLANLRFFDDVRPGDNLIPLFFAEKIYGHQPVSPICCGDWLSSDRPPLQAGIFLLERPFHLLGSVGLQYQAIGTVLQCLWICGVWALLRSVRVPKQRVPQALGFLVFSGFMFYNTVYVWPKLLAATFVLFTLAILLDAWIHNRALNRSEGVLAAASFSLAVLAHPGSLFSLPALAFLWLSRTRFANVRTLPGGALIALGFALPWIGYQRFYDPPGNRLLKMHLAGVIAADSRSTWQAIEHSYASLPASVLLRNKWRNVEALIGPQFLTGFSFDSAARRAQREYISDAIGLMNIGWLVAAAALVRKKIRLALPCSGVLIGLALMDFLIWALVIFGPGWTLTEYSSYTDILVLSIGLLSFMLLLPRAVLMSLLGVQVANFFLVWVLFKPPLIPLPNNTRVSPVLHWPMLIMGALFATVVIWHSSSSFLAQSTHGIDERSPASGCIGREQRN